MDENLQSVGDLVKEALETSGDTSIKEGIKSQAELDAEQAAAKPAEETIKEPVIPQEGLKSPDAPLVQGQTPVLPGDKVEGVAPVVPVTPEPSTFEITWKEKFGDQSVDDVKAEMAKSKGFEERTVELQKLYDDSSAKLSQKLDPWATPEMAELNQFVKETGISDTGLFKTLKGADLHSMEARKIMEINMAKDNPNLSQRDIQEYIDDNYNQVKENFDHIDDDDDRKRKEDDQDRAIRRGKTNLEIDANKARTILIDLQDKIKPVDLAAQAEATQKEYEEKVQKATEGWTPHIAKSIEGLRQYKIEIPGENGQTQELASFEVPADHLKVYGNQAMQFAVNQGLDPNSVEGQTEVNRFIANMIIIDHKDQIVQKAVTAARAGMELEVEREISNPTGDKLPVNSDQTPVHDPKPKTTEDHEEEAFAGAMKQLDEGEY